MNRSLLKKYKLKVLIWSFLILISNVNLANTLTAEDYFYKGLEYHLENNLKNAEENYIESYKLKKDKDTAYNIALLYDTQNKITLAEMYYKEAIKYGKNEAYYNLGYLYSQQKKINLAIQNYAESVNTTENVDAMYNLGIIFKDLEDYKNSLTYFQMAYDKGDAESLYWIANMNEKLGNLDVAESNYKIIADNNLYAAYNLARIYENKNDKQNAIKYYEKSKIDINESYYRLGLLYEDLKNIQKSEENYKIYIDKTKDLPAMISLANMYEINNRLSDAEKLYEQVFKQNNSLDNMFYLARIKEKQKKYAEAEKYYEELNKKLPKNRKNEALVGLINVYQAQNKEEEMIKILNSSNFVNLNDPSILYNIGVAFDKSENKEKAEEYYLKSIDKGNDEISKLAINNLAILYYSQEKLENSLIYYKKLTDDYNIKDYAFNTGLIYSQLKIPQEAKKYFEIAYNSGNEKALYHLAMSYYDLNEITEAKKLFQRAANRGDKDAKLMLEGM